MKHLDSQTLNLYLDDLLAADARALADAHLVACAECQLELTALRAVQASLNAWRAEPIPRDVTPLVMARLATRPVSMARQRWGVLALGAQLLAAAVILFGALPTLLRLLNPLSLQTFPTLSFDFVQNLAVMRENLNLPLPSVAIWVWVLALLGGVVLWLVANRLALRALNHAEVPQ